MREELFTQTLFTEANPKKLGYKTHAESSFAYLNTHTDSPVMAIRQTLESWYSRFPMEERRNLVGRFRSGKSRQHLGAFWELYLHELLHQMGFEVEAHPSLEHTKTNPDFLIYSDGIPVAFVEARLAGLPTDAEEAAETLKGELHDTLDKVKSPNFFLKISELTTASTRPSFKKLSKQIEAWLQTLDPDWPAECFLDSDTHPSFSWEDAGWVLLLTVIPRSHESRGKEGIRSVGMFSGSFKWLDTRGELRRALSEKSGKYGKLQTPLILAINHMGLSCAHTDWIDTLFGSSAWNVALGKDGTHTQVPFRENNGFWFARGIPQHRHVSLILAGFNVTPASMAAEPHHLRGYVHFAPEKHIDLAGNLSCWHFSKEKDDLVLLPGRSSAEILGLPDGWPGWHTEDLSLSNGRTREQ